MQNPNFVLREIFGKALLMPIRRNKIGQAPIHLNDIAANIWKNANDCSDSSVLLARVSTQYNLEPNSTEQRIVEDFINNLIDIGILYEN